MTKTMQHSGSIIGHSLTIGVTFLMYLLNKSGEIPRGRILFSVSISCRGSIYPPASPEGEADGGQVEPLRFGLDKSSPYKTPIY